MNKQERRIMRLNNSKDIIEVTKDGNVLLVLKEDSTFADEPKRVTNAEVTKTTEHERYRFYREKSKRLEKKYAFVVSRCDVLAEKVGLMKDATKDLNATFEEMRKQLFDALDKLNSFRRHRFLGFTFYTRRK